MSGSGIQEVGSQRFRDWLADVGVDPSVAIIAGSGMAGLANCMQLVGRARLSDLLDVTVPPVVGHVGDVLLGTIQGVPSVLFLGRLHLYQGLTPWETVSTVRALAGTSVSTLVVTNAAGGLNPAFQVGDTMLITDHINLPGLSGISPLIPPPLEKVTFTSMRGAYDQRLSTVMSAAADSIGHALQRGVYVMVAGPNFETDAELRMLRSLGADAVGMSTVHEVLMARWLGISVVGLSLITNRAVAGEDSIPSHQEVLRAGAAAQTAISALLGEFVSRVAES